MLIDNAAYVRVAGLVQPSDYFDPLHGQIHETIGLELEAGRLVNPVTLKTLFERHEPIDATLSVPQYLGRLGVNACSIVNAPDYARLITELATRRLIIDKSERMRQQAYDAPAGAWIGESLAKDIDHLERIGASTAMQPVIQVAGWADQPAPPRQWHVPDMIPAGNATLIFGDGGTGKSLIAAQLGVATVTGRDWFGQNTRRGPVVYVGAEDDTDEMHRRLDGICKSEGISLDRLEDFHLLCLAGADAVLATADEGTSIVRPTALWQRVRRLVRTKRPALVILDTLADLFAGNENNRAQARQFVSMLRGLAMETGCAMVLLAHPSVAGMANGTGTSGSTGWSNSVRSRLYLTREKQGDTEVDPDVRVLRTMKANYGPAGGEIRLRWQQGTFAVSNPADGASPQVQAQQAKADAVFLDLLRTHTSQGRHVGATPSVSYAPTVFAQQAKARGVNKSELAAAMNRLLEAGRIQLTESGPASKRRQRLEVAS